MRRLIAGPRTSKILSSFADSGSGAARRTLTTARRELWVRTSVSASEADIDVSVRRWDSLGVIVSAICVVHCTAVPLVLGLLPAFGLSFLAEDGFHQVLAALVLVVAVAAFVPGYRLHRQRSVPALGALGIALLGGAAFAPGLSVLVESVVTAIGGTVLVVAHVLNRRARASVHASAPAHEHAH